MALTPSKDRSVADIYKDLKSISDVMGSATEQKLKGIAEAYKPIDPNILQQALQEGGSLSSAGNLAASDFWAMTPQSFQQTMQMQPNLVKQISDATQISDVVGNRSATRKSLEDAAMRQAQTESGLLNQAIGIEQGGVERSFRAGESAAERSFRGSEAAKDRALKERELTYPRTTEGTGFGFGSPFANKGRAELAQKNLASLSKPGEKLDIKGLQSKLEYDAYSGNAQVGSVVDINQIALVGNMFNRSLPIGDKRYKYAALGEDGWYGIEDFDPNTGKPTGFSSIPLVHIVPNQPITGGGRGGGSVKSTPTAKPKYAPAGATGSY